MKQAYIIELTGESPDSWRLAVQNAITEAGKSFDNITGVEITSLKAKVENGKLVRYSANMKITYL
ncbi:flavin-binding protein dodecin [Desulfohalotomaculum tongense]|uniref:dodecin family protein n=1 Tax=Desulforadius tongensis TaxID=1216062 RepID=UPI0030845CA4|nr:flavin-binding protein dodecin [Desulforadius tongensis]